MSRVPVDQKVFAAVRNFYAAGLNYKAHIDWANIRGGSYKVPAQPDIGYRSAAALIPNGAEIVIPADSPGPVEYEGELVAVIGKKARNLTEKNALDCVQGYTLGNDVSERGWQKSDRTLWRAKSADTFKPMGPFIATGIEPRDMTTVVRLNGEVVHTFPTGNMLFSAGEVISDISRTNTLSPGDVVWLGTDELPQSIEPGDTIEIEISGIGVLRNRVVAGP